MTRAEELLNRGTPAEQADVVAAFLDLEGWTTYAEIVRRLAKAIEARGDETTKIGTARKRGREAMRPNAPPSTNRSHHK